jgi:hypothetical protein
MLFYVMEYVSKPIGGTQMYELQAARGKWAKKVSENVHGLMGAGR